MKFDWNGWYSKVKGPYYNLKYLVARDPEGHNNDGDGNEANDKGFHDSTFARFSNSYADGISSLPTNLPVARAVSNAVMNQGTQDIPNTFGVNEFFQFFGQALTHDIAEAAVGVLPGDTEITGGDPPSPRN